MDNNKYSKTTLTIYIIFIFATKLTDIALFNKTKIQQTDYASTIIGFVTFILFYFNSQRLLNENHFFKFGLFGLFVFIICLTKQFMTSIQILPLFMATVPFIFVIYFRVLTYLFYKDYPNKKPVIVFASQYSSASYDGKDKGYIPTMKEKTFSLLLFMGFMFFAFGLILLLKSLFKFV